MDSVPCHQYYGDVPEILMREQWGLMVLPEIYIVEPDDKTYCVALVYYEKLLNLIIDQIDVGTSLPDYCPTLMLNNSAWV